MTKAEQERHRQYGIELGRALGEYYKAKAVLEQARRNIGWYTDVVASAYNIEASCAANIGRLVARHLKELQAEPKEGRCCE